MFELQLQNNKVWLYSVVVITFGFDPNNSGSNPDTTFLLPLCTWFFYENITVSVLLTTVDLVLIIIVIIIHLNRYIERLYYSSFCLLGINIVYLYTFYLLFYFSSFFLMFVALSRSFMLFTPVLFICVCETFFFFSKINSIEKKTLTLITLNQTSK